MGRGTSVSTKCHANAVSLDPRPAPLSCCRPEKIFTTQSSLLDGKPASVSQADSAVGERLRCSTSTAVASKDDQPGG